MRLRATILCLLLTAPTIAGIDERFRAMREVSLYYGFSDNPGAYAMLLSLWRFENGRDGREAGHENKRMDAEVYANPCLAPGSYNYAKSARAMIRFTMDWVMRDEWRRREWCKAFASFYHSGGVDKNKEYAKIINVIWKEEYSKVKAGLYVPTSNTLF